MPFDPQDPRLTASLLGEIDDADRDAVDALLAADPDAARFLEGLRATAGRLTDALGAEPAPGLSIVQRLELESRLRVGNRRPLLRTVAGLAAAFLLALGGFGIGLISARSPDRLGRAGELVASAEIKASPMMDKSSIDAADSAMPAREQGRARLTEAEAQATPDGVPNDFALATEGTARKAELGARQKARAEGGFASESVEFRGFAGPAGPLASEPSNVNRAEVDRAALGMQPGLEAIAEDDRGSAASRIDERDTSGGMAGMGGAMMGGTAPSSTPSPEYTPTADSGLAVADRADQDKSEPPPNPGVAGQSGLEKETERAAQASSATREGAMLGGAQRLGQRPLNEGLSRSIVALQGVNQGSSRDQSPARASEALEAQTASGTKRARVTEPNVVEVDDLPIRQTTTRLVHPEPVIGVQIDMDGSRVLSTSNRRSFYYWNANSGALINTIRVDQGSMPEVRLTPAGALLVTNAEPQAAVEAGGPFLAVIEFPLIPLPLRTESLTLPMLEARLVAEGLPLEPPVSIAALVNAAPPPDLAPSDDEALAFEAEVTRAPWNIEHLLVRTTFRAGRAIEDVRAEIAPNPDRADRLRVLGIDPRPSPSGGQVSPEGLPMQAGDSVTLLLEVVPPQAPMLVEGGAMDLAEGLDGEPLPRKSPTAVELFGLRDSYAMPDSDRVERQTSVADTVTPIAEGTEALRRSVALGWLGLVLAGDVPDPIAALDGIAALIQPAEGEPDAFGRQFREVIERVRSMTGDRSGVE